jgi:hypothetical protein
MSGDTIRGEFWTLKEGYFGPTPKEVFDEMNIAMEPDLSKYITGVDPVKEPQVDKALRYNEGKLRYDLLDPYAIQELVRVFTFGAKKYADHNWKKGMKWSKILASLKRHIAEFEMGTEIDPESKCHHMALAAWNALALVTYSQIYPQGDDRPHAYLNYPKVGLDIDEVLCDWVGAWCQKFGYEIPDSWSFSYQTYDHFKSMEGKELEDFYLNIPPKIDPKDLPFEPHCYITSRSVPLELTQKWLQKNGFPTVKVYSVGFGASKVNIAKESGIDVFIDDRFENFVELNKAGICTYLLDAKHNRRYDVGYKRIFNLKDFLKK